MTAGLYCYGGTFVTRDPARVKQFRATRSSRLSATNMWVRKFFVVSGFFFLNSFWILPFIYYLMRNFREIFPNRSKPRTLSNSWKHHYRKATLQTDGTKSNPSQSRNFLISPDTVTLYRRNVSRVQSGGNSWTKRNDTLVLLRIK